jgi:signal transduction histidine kinase
VVLAAQAGAAVESHVLSERLRHLAVQAERDRISRDLHDNIIQSLFSIGMNLESAASLVTTAPERAQQRISGAVDRIDDAIRDLRNTIFHLRPNTAAILGLREGIVELAREHEVNALARPKVELDSSLDVIVPTVLVPDVLQVVRESLANVARHAGPCSVTIRARVPRRGAGRRDRGRRGRGSSPPLPSVGRGLENVEERAAVLGPATMEIDSPPRVTAPG